MWRQCVSSTSPFERPGETPQETGRRFEKFFAKLFGREPQRGSGNIWHMPLDVGSIALLFSLKFSTKDKLRWGSTSVRDLFKEIDRAADSRTGALAIHEQLTGETYVVFRANDFLRMSQSGDIHYMTPSKGEQKRARSKVPSLLREDENG